MFFTFYIPHIYTILVPVVTTANQRDNIETQNIYLDHILQEYVWRKILGISDPIAGFDQKHTTKY